MSNVGRSPRSDGWVSRIPCLQKARHGAPVRLLGGCGPPAKARSRFVGTPPFARNAKDGAPRVVVGTGKTNEGWATRPINQGRFKGPVSELPSVEAQHCGQDCIRL